VPWVLIVWALSATGLIPFSLVMPAMVAGVFVLYYVGYEGFHHLMHKPSIPGSSAGATSSFLKRHHRIHHFRMDRNLNVLLPVADFLLGSLVTKADEPAGNPEGARKLARRHSQFGRRLRTETGPRAGLDGRGEQWKRACGDRD
jgi:sterol desaturase/sphingolipid hydroxylase (fatty acid hydroxylase superfamily)